MPLALLATALFLAPTAAGLSVGDPAPPLTFSASLKGNPVRSFSRSKVTVVEFWATWCKPCIEGMPHISKLWAKYKERADFVGVSVMENDQKLVKPFVERLGDNVTYPLALDKVSAKDKGFMIRNWLEAAGQREIPMAFIVDRNARIAWIGAPTAMEPVLSKVVEGTWDAHAYKARFDAARKNEEISALLVNESFDRISRTVRTHSYAETLGWIDRNRARYNAPEAQAALDEFRKLFNAFLHGDYASALEQASAQPTNGIIWTYFRPMLLVARIAALQSLNRDEWREAALKAIDGPPDPNMLMALTDALSLPESKLTKDPALALKAGENLASLARVPLFLLRLAWAQFANGQTTQAIATLEEATRAMELEKQRNPKSYTSLLRRIREAKAYMQTTSAAREKSP